MSVFETILLAGLVFFIAISVLLVMFAKDLFDELVRLRKLRVAARDYVNASQRDYPQTVIDKCYADLCDVVYKC